MSRTQLQNIITNFSAEKLESYIRANSPQYRPAPEDFQKYLDEEKWGSIEEIQKIGQIEFDEFTHLTLVVVRSDKQLSEKIGRKQQYDLGKEILKKEQYDAGLFVFHDDEGCFRFSLINARYRGKKRDFTNPRRYTYFVDKDLPNKNFLNQISKANFSSIDTLLESFSIATVSDEFYDNFKKKYEPLAAAVKGAGDAELKGDFTLLFAIRIIFLGFVQKKGWLGKDTQFIQNYWKAYQDTSKDAQKFYTDWLTPLFFEALNTPVGYKVKYGNNDYPDHIEKALQEAPYLNGELFKKKAGVDDKGLVIPDEAIGNFLDFLFEYNFTIEENTLYDEELELNPEFLGIIFERLVNKDMGAVYTPRVEVDMMCRLALVKWLEKNVSWDEGRRSPFLNDLYELFFREGGKGEEHDVIQRDGNFSTGELDSLIEKLEMATICDPSAGSGAFLVGMLQVIEEILSNLYNRSNLPEKRKKSLPDKYDLKKQIIGQSLYGVDVMRWAVWINQLRLWLSLFVDMPKDFNERYHDKPLLPSLGFKVRRGDSLVQRIGSKTFPVQGHHVGLPRGIKTRITKLKTDKQDYFHNRNNVTGKDLSDAECKIFSDILGEEISEKRKLIDGFATPQATQGELLSDKPDNHQEPLKVSKAAQKKLESEIQDLRDQQNSLLKENPFIWNIEFSEIFFERGGFDIIIGNPPYVEQEKISDPYQKLNEKEYKSALQEMVHLDFDGYFSRFNPKKPTAKIDGKSDLLVFFYIRSLRILNKQGVHVFICSNTWLDAEFGGWLQSFLLQKIPMSFIIDNHARRSFENADVNTVITVFSAPVNKSNKSQNKIKFIAYKQPFENIIFTENLLKIEDTSELIKTEAFRVYPRSYNQLLIEGRDDLGSSYKGDKWGGKYLRSPDVISELLDKSHPKIIKLRDIAEVKFGIKTGANKFFYLTLLEEISENIISVQNGAGWTGEIEKQFLVPVIKSPREEKKINIDKNNLKLLLFKCHKEKKQLVGTKALEYIEWGENATTGKIKQGKDRGKTKVGYQNISSIKSRKRWYDVGDRITPQVIIPAGIADTYKSYSNKVKCFADKRLYDVSSPYPNLIFILNSTFYHIIQEINSRSGLGQGLLDLTVNDVKTSYICDCRDLDFSNVDEGIFSRNINSVFIECGIDPALDIPIEEQNPKPLSDRKILDNIIFDALDLTEDERKNIYRGVCQLVYERQSRANSINRK